MSLTRVQGYFRQVANALDLNPTWRVGQAYFNVLNDMCPDVGSQLVGTELDPFYDDSRVSDFLSVVIPRITEGE